VREHVHYGASLREQGHHGIATTLDRFARSRWETANHLREARQTIAELRARIRELEEAKEAKET
jgi:hypothetical protein